MTRRARILLARRDPAAAAPCAAALARSGHDVRTAPLDDLAATVTSVRPDLVVCDVSSETAQQLTDAVAIDHPSGRPLVLAVVGRRAEGVAALEAFADAFLLAPFGLHDLEVHATALLRRSASAGVRVQRLGPLSIDAAARRISCDDREVDLPNKEFEILLALAAVRGRVVSKRALLQRVWGFDTFDENLVEVHVSTLRRLLPPAGRVMVQTVRGSGYRLTEPGTQEHTA